MVVWEVEEVVRGGPSDGPDGYICQQCRQWVTGHVCGEETGDMDIPAKIYLQIKDEDGETPDEITWCVDKIHDTDVEYVRAEGSGGIGAAA